MVKAVDRERAPQRNPRRPSSPPSSSRRRHGLRFTAPKTMTLAQRLYEGVELGDERPRRPHHVHAHRLDAAVRRGPGEARDVHRRPVRRRLPAGRPPFYQTRKSAQDAHEAIRPTSLEHPPGARWPVTSSRRPAGALPADLEPLRRLPDGPGGLRHPDARTSRPGRTCSARRARQLQFPGLHAPSTARRPTSRPRRRPRRTRGRGLGAAAARGGRAPRPAPARAEAALHPAAAALHRGDAGEGAGGEGHRPAVDLRPDPATIQEREYVEKEEGRFSPTELGEMVNDLLVKHFPDISTWRSPRRWRRSSTRSRRATASG